MREAFWISLVVHAAVVLAVIFLLPKLAARHALPNALNNFVLNHEMVFLEAPPAPKPTERPQTDKMSDQDRQAALRRPQPDAKTLKELFDLHAPGAPNKERAQAQAAQPASPQVPPSPAQQAQPAGGRAQAQQQAQFAENGQPHAPPLDGRSQRGNGNPFSSALSAGSQIQQAVRASAENRTSVGSGDYGDIPTPPQTDLHSNLDILSDTMGVDFGPYLSRVLEEIRRNWYNIIPEEARAPLMKQGKVSIRFVINKDGSVAGMKVLYPSGDVALDRAAWGGITASNPFQRLPGEFRGPYLALACTFYYNPDRNDLR
jgi:TonB family protein